MSKKMILLLGNSGEGKTSALRNLDLESTVYIDTDRKGIKSFKDMDKFNQWIKLDYVDHLIPGLEAIENDDSVKTVVVDTLSIALDMFVAQKIDGAADSRTMWGEYKVWFNKIMNQAKLSKKDYVFISHTKTIYDEQEMESRTFAYAQGSIASRIESHFAVVAYAHKYLDENQMPAYGLLVNPTKEKLHLSVKSPMSMFDEPLILDNDVNILFKAIEEY